MEMVVVEAIMVAEEETAMDMRQDIQAQAPVEAARLM